MGDSLDVQAVHRFYGVLICFCLVWSWDAFTAQINERMITDHALLGFDYWGWIWVVTALMSACSVSFRWLRSPTLALLLFCTTSMAVTFIVSLGAAGLAPAVLWFALGWLITIYSAFVEGGRR